MLQEFDKLLAMHCSPALAGIKPGNLVSCSKEKFPDLPKLLRIYSTAMWCTGLRFEVLYQCDRNYLVLVYREELLRSSISKPENMRILHDAGYPANTDDITEIIDFLKSRFANCDEFPHEIGLFLGYPAEDVLGFWENSGKNYKLCGYWKVYTDVEKAKKKFNQFDKCRSGVCRRLDQGVSIIQIFCAA